MSKFPAIPPNRDKNPTVEKLRELIQIWKGERGNALDQVITRRDLLDAKIAILGKGGNISPGSAITPTPIHIGPLFNLFASGGFKFVFLEWEGTNQNGYSYTEIHRSSTDNLANAILVGTSLAPLFADVSVNSNQTYYYWVRAVSTSNNKGAFNATAGTPATTVLEPQYVADLLQGMIDSSHLVAELLTPIQSIPSIQTTLDDHDIRLPALEDYVDIIDAKVAAFRDLPTFDQNNDYDIGDIVKYGGIAWRALVNMTAPSATPIEGANWTTIGNYATYDGVLSGNAQAISDLSSSVTDLDGVVTSQASSITSIQSSLNDIIISDFDASQNYAIDDVFRYNNEYYKVIATQTQPNATPPNATYYVVSPDYSSLQTDVSANAAALSALDTRVVAAEGTITSHSSSLTSLSSSISSLTTDTQTNASAISDLNTETTTQAGQITANSNAITLIQSDVTALENADAATATAINQLTTRVTEAEGEIDSQALSITSINSSISAINGDIISVNGLINANADAIGLLDTRVIATEGSITTLSQDLTQLQADVQNLDVEGSAQAISDLSARVTATEDDITAIGQDLTTLYTSVGDNYAAIQDKAEVSVVANLDGEVQSILAQRTIKLDVNGYVSGIALMNDGVTSEMIIASDSVLFVDPGQSVTPFVPGQDYASLDAVRNTQLVFGYAKVEGLNRFVINVPAYIPDATITNAKINDLNVSKLVGNTASFVLANIGTANITDAMIGNIIQSTGFVPGGGGGWQINKNGHAEFNDIAIYDPDGRLAFASGLNYMVTVDHPPESVYFTKNWNLTETNTGESRPSGIVVNYDGVWENESNYTYIDSNAKTGFYLGYLHPGHPNAGSAKELYVFREPSPVSPGKTYKYKARIKLVHFVGVSDSIPTVALYAAIRNGALPANTDYVANITQAGISVSTAQRYVVSGTTVNALSGSPGSTTSIYIDLEGDVYIPGSLTEPYAAPAVRFQGITRSCGIFVEYLSITDLSPTISTTYIRDAAITEAKIGTAAVDTLKIKENAVTVIQIAEFASGYYSNSAWNNVGSFVVSHGFTDDVLILFDISSRLKMSTGGSNSANQGRLRFDVNGVSYISETVDMSRTTTQTGSAPNFQFWTVTSSSLIRIRKALMIPNNSLVEIYVTGSSGSGSAIGVQHSGTTATATAAKR